MICRIGLPFPILEMVSILWRQEHPFAGAVLGEHEGHPESARWEFLEVRCAVNLNTITLLLFPCMHPVLAEEVGVQLARFYILGVSGCQKADNQKAESFHGAYFNPKQNAWHTFEGIQVRGQKGKGRSARISLVAGNEARRLWEAGLICLEWQREDLAWLKRGDERKAAIASWILVPTAAPKVRSPKHFRWATPVA
jgi:hypothetical protein